MVRRRAVSLAAGVVTATAGAACLPGAAAGQGTPPLGPGSAGPPYPYATELMGGGSFLPLPDQAALTRTDHGYLYRAGQQDSDLEITLTADGIRFADAGTLAFKRLAGVCTAEKTTTGVSALCPVPADLSGTAPVLVEVWPRLGDDVVDGSSLPDTVAMTVLGDAGHDVARFGAGPDFFNGHTGRDQVWGGGGDDWIRSGAGADSVWGGDGDDQLVGTDGRDRFYGEGGADLVRCEGGTDAVVTDGKDRLRDCESVESS